MKKVIYGIIILTLMFAIKVEAKDMAASSIPNGSYVIGNYEFTRDKTENYNGTLTIQHIMLAAKTIASNDVEDMKIYYKNSRGTWVDPVTNKSIATNALPETFPIEYVNLESTIYNYNIEYRLNGGTQNQFAPSLITTATSDESISVGKPSKTFTINIDANSQGASIMMEDTAVVSVSDEQEFAGWTTENLDPRTAKYEEGLVEAPSNSWDGTTKVGMNSNTTTFSELRSSAGTVTLVANWNAVQIPLPKVEKAGYECSLNTNPQGFGESYASDGIYIPTTATSSTTLYVRCTSRMLSSSVFSNINKNDFESIATQSRKIVPTSAIESWDASENHDGSIMAWYLDEDQDGKYELYIGQDGGVIANTYSQDLFSYFENLDSLNLTNYDTKNVTNMSGMFLRTGSNSSNFTLNLGDKFDTSNVTDMSSMFAVTGIAGTLNLGNKFDTSNVTDMSRMFQETGCDSTTFTLNLGDNFDTSKVTNMSNMFYRTGYVSTGFTLNLGESFDTSSVTDMSSMFESTGEANTNFTLNLGDKFDTSNVTDMSRMFFNTGFSSAAFTLDLGDNFDTSEVTDMSLMFAHTGHNDPNFALNLGDNFDTSEVTNMEGMFRATGYASEDFTLNLGDLFDTSNVVNMIGMFDETGYSSTVFTLDLGDNFDTSNVTNMSGMFNCTGYSNPLFALDLGNSFDTTSVTNMSYMFADTGAANDYLELDLSTFDFTNVESYEAIFLDMNTTGLIWVKDSTAQNWIITNSGNSNLRTSNVLVKI